MTCNFSFTCDNFLRQGGGGREGGEGGREKGGTGGFWLCRNNNTQ